MLIHFFLSLKDAGLPVSIREFLDLLDALRKRLVFASVDEFYLLSRTVLIKDEKNFDKYDRAFGAYFHEINDTEFSLDKIIPEDWLTPDHIKTLSDKEREAVASLGGLDKLLETFKERLEEQQKRHQGGSKWVGTGGTSPFGNSGYNPEGIRVGGDGKNKRAVKVWEKRQYKNLDDSVALGIRNIQVALRKLRKFARTGAADELDLSDTISSTARNAGLLDIKMVPERHNQVKVLLFLDVGGSMDPYVKTCEELFSACRNEFKHLEHFYFHNCVYESVWKDNLRKRNDSIQTIDILAKYSRDYRVIFVGDASMSPYEILSPYGSVDHMNETPGREWVDRIKQKFDRVAWLNPVQQEHWDYTQSISIVHDLVEGNMFPLTLAGLESSIKYLSR